MTAPVLGWLEQVLDDAEREARWVGQRRLYVYDDGVVAWNDGETWADGSDIVPNRRRDYVLLAAESMLLAGVVADRAILAEHAQVKASGGRGVGCRTCDSGFDGYSVCERRGECRTVILMASRYRHRPGYVAGWAP